MLILTPKMTESQDCRRTMPRTVFVTAILMWVVDWHSSYVGRHSVGAQETRVLSDQENNSFEVKNARVLLIDKVTLASPRAGVLASVEYREGDSVETNQVIAGLDSEVAKATLRIATHKAASTVDRRYARKAIELAESEHDKAKQANESIPGAPVFTPIDMHRLKLTVDKTKLQLEQAESEAKINSLTVEQQTAELKTYTVVAPFSGTVTKIYRSKGEAVSLGEPIADIANLKRVRVEGFVDVQTGLKAKPGSKVRVRLDLPAIEPAVEFDDELKEFVGKLIFVDIGVEAVSGQIRVWAEVPNPDGILRAGLPARMVIEHEKVKLPSSK